MSVHLPSLGPPAGAWPHGGAHDQTARFRTQLDLLGQVGSIEQKLRHPDPARVANPYDTGLRRHVITV
jgi:hypothetical protein